MTIDADELAIDATLTTSQSRPTAASFHGDNLFQNEPTVTAASFESYANIIAIKHRPSPLPPPPSPPNPTLLSPSPQTKSRGNFMKFIRRYYIRVKQRRKTSWKLLRVFAPARRRVIFFPFFFLLKLLFEALIQSTLFLSLN